MSIIDNRIVKMVFDNKQFESGVQTSIKSLDNLKKGLKLDESAKSLQNLEKAGKNFSMTGMERSVDLIAGKFSALGIMGVTALANITNSAINAGKRIVSALTIDPIMAGFSEYETQINAVQTILANTSSKGKTIKDVNAALDELNTYADKTIYNFTEMTRNIGTFTAAGVDLDTSVNAIKGIANLAAVSGSTSQQASTAMYQLSQALASGTVKLMDWNSVVNAGMGGEVFQNALKETARVHGINIDQMIKEQGSFRETLQEGWLTSEILTETLQKFTLTKEGLTEAQIKETEAMLKAKGYTEAQIKAIWEMGATATDAATKVKTFTQLFDTLKEAAQSGWTQSWEIIVGDFEEAKMMFTEVSNVFGEMIGQSAELRNNMLQTWKDLGGRTVLIEAVRDVFHGLMDTLKPIKEAFDEIFPAMTGQQLFDITQGIKNLTAQFKISETTAENLKRTFEGVFAAIDIGLMVIKAFGKGIFDILGSIMPVGDGILGITANMGDFVVSIRNFIKEGNLINKVIGGITGGISKAINTIREFISGLASTFTQFANLDTSGIDNFVDRVEIRLEPLNALGNILSTVFTGLGELIKKLMPVAISFAGFVGRGVTAASEAISNALDNANFSNIIDTINAFLTGGLIIGIKKFVDGLSNLTDAFKGMGKNIGGNVGGFLANITGILDGVKGSLEAYQSNLKAKTLSEIAKAIAILAASLFVLALIDSNKLAGALGAMTTMFIELFGAMAAFEKIMGSSGFKAMAKISTGMIALSSAVLILSFAMKNLASLDWGGLTKGLVGVGALLAMMVAVANSLSKIHGKIVKGAGGLILFAAAINVLAMAVKSLSTLNAGQLTKGLIGVGVLCAELALFLKVANFDKMGILKGTGMLILAAAINVLASAVGKFGNLDPNTIVKGLSTMGMVLLELAAFTQLTGNAKHVVSTSIAMTILGAAMLIFAEAVGRMGNLSWEQIGKGLLTMAGALAAITVAMSFMPPTMILSSIGMIAIAGALVILSHALKTMGSMTWGEIAKGLVALAGSLTIIAVAVTLMIAALPGAAALLVIAGALAILTPVLKVLGGMSLSEIGKGLLALAGIFVVFGVAAAVLSPLTPTLLALGAAIALFGVACLAVGAGILAFSAGLAALAVSGTAGAGALVLIVSSLIGLIPMVIQKIGEGIIAFANVITQGAPAILNAAKTLLLGLVNAVVEITVPLIEAVLTLLLTLIQKIAEKVPDFVQAGFDILIAFLEGIRDNIGQVVDVAIDIVLNFLDALVDKWQVVIDAGFDLVIKFIDGLADSVEKNIPRVVTSIIGLGGAIIKGLVDSLFAGVNKVVDVAKDIGKSLIDGFKNVLGLAGGAVNKFKEMAGDIISGLINGIKEKLQGVKDAAVELGSTIVNSVKNFLGIQSPSKVMKNEVGVWIVKGIAEGIKKDMSAEEAAEQKAKNIVNAFKKELDKFDLDASTADLEYQLWETLSGDKATDAQKAEMEAATLTKKIESMNQKVLLAQDEYNETVKYLGKDSENAQEAYNKYLKAQIEVAELVAKLDTLQKERLQKEQEAKKAYYDYIRENDYLVGTAGLTYEDISNSATAISGYDPYKLQENMTTDVQSAVTESMATVQTVYSQNAQNTFGSLLTDYSNWGHEYATKLANGIKERAPLAKAETTALITGCLEKLKESRQSWYDSAVNLVDGFIAGIKDNIERAAMIVVEMADDALEAAREALSIASPSKKFAEIGRYTAEGFAVGIAKYANVPVNAVSEMSNTAIEGMQDSIKKIAEVMNSDMDMNPTIRPVIDLTDVKAGEKQIQSMLDKTHGISVNASLNRASSISNRMSTSTDDKGQINNPQSMQGASFNFTQNNYSPKSLSQIEIYRQTRNQFSALKGLVTAK